ncbi:MAG TPA: hypothetical protein VIL34_05050 [Actinopolymorphaceae bacterium]
MARKARTRVILVVPGMASAAAIQVDSRVDGSGTQAVRAHPVP